MKISTNDTVKLTRMEAEENEDMKHENENEMKMEITAFPGGFLLFQPFNCFPPWL